MNRRIDSFSKFCLILFLLSAFACNREEKKDSTANTPQQKYNVILLSIDTLRADYLKPFNPAGVDTPNLEKICQNAIVFKKAISQIPYTLPSHSSMLTGVYPVAHRVWDNVHDVLSSKIPTLAEIFKKENYQTAGFIGSMVLSGRTGLSRGFDYYDDYFSRADMRLEDVGGLERRAEDVVASFENWFDKRDQGKNFFIFLHFYDPHSPYDPPADFYPSVREPKELYKGEIRYVDSVLGQLFDYLRTKAVLHSTIIAIVSDHGEMLSEHGEIGHGFFLYEAALRVPFILILPQQNGKREVQDVVQLVDIAPTLLNLNGVKIPEDMQGESLDPIIQNSAKKKNRLGFSESYFASLHLGVAPIKSAQDERYKFINAPKPELYDLLNDAMESKNLAEEKPDVTQQWKQKIALYQQHYEKLSKAEDSERSVSAEEAAGFAALGYVGWDVPEEAWKRTEDPKDYIAEWNATLEVAELLTTGEYEKALEVVRRIARRILPEKEGGNVTLTNAIGLMESKCYMGMRKFGEAERILSPMRTNSEALSLLAQVYIRSGQQEKAESAYRELLQKNFSYFELYNFVLFLKQTGHHQEAIDVLKNTKQIETDSNEARPFLAEIYMLLENWQKAEQLLVKLIDDRPWEVKWYLQLAGVYQKTGRTAQALNLLTSNYERFSRKADYLMRLGIIYNQLGQSQQELATFQEMIKVSPGDARGYFYLAKAMLDHKLDLDNVIRLTLKGFELNPDLRMQIFGHYILGNAFEMTGKVPESRKEFQIAEKLEKSISGI